jgi:chemotaxis signal transduction protein
MADRRDDANVVFRVAGERFALPAGAVARVAPMPRLSPLPGARSPFLGVTSLSDAVVPVIDLSPVLGLARSDRGGGEAVVVRHGKHTYALAVDQVLRVATTRNGDDTPRRPLDLGEVIARLPLARAAAAASAPVDRPVAPTSRMQAGMARRQWAEQAALAVETGTGSHHLPLDHVIRLADDLAVAAVPDPDPVFAGTAFHHGRAIAVLRLDRLLGEPVAAAGPQAFAIVAHRGAAVALAVRRIGGAVSGVERDRLLPIAALLDPIVPPQTDWIARPAGERSGAQRHPRYLIVEIGTHAFAFPLRDVNRVQDECRIVPVAAGRFHVHGLTTVGGRVVPVLDAAAVLGLDRHEAAQGAAAQEEAAQGYAGGYVVANPAAGDFVVAVERQMRLASIPDASLRHVGKDSPVVAFATVEGRTIRVLSAPLLARRAGWRRDAA